jgi:hypothetical protein
MTKPTHAGKSRKHYYEEAIRATLRGNGLRSAEVERLLREVGFTKLRFLAPHVRPGTADRWIDEAQNKRTLVIQQEYDGRRRQVPDGERLQDFVLHLTGAVRKLLIDALKAHGRDHDEGRYRGGNVEREPDDEAVKGLLAEAGRLPRGVRVEE